MIKSGPRKKRGERAYTNKLRRLKKRYDYTVKHRQTANATGVAKKPLREFEYFADQVKKPTKG